MRSFALAALGIGILGSNLLGSVPVWSQSDSRTETCEILIAGGGLGGVAAAYEGLRLGRKVCMTEITDWIGGQVSSQGVSALDERPLQRENGIFPLGYQEFRSRVVAAYDGNRNPGQCWVSVLCFSPQVGHQVIEQMLQPYLDSGQLQLFTDTVIKSVKTSPTLITQVEAITNTPRRPELAGGQRGNLSEYFLDWYDPQPSADWDKQVVTFVPPAERQTKTLPWMVIDATETGELYPLAQIPYQLGTDQPNPRDPSVKQPPDPYCTQGFTYPFVMERVSVPQVPIKPPFYDQPEHGRYYSYEQKRFDFAALFTYRRIRGQVPGMKEEAIRVGDQSMQNWTWGNDWRISTPQTNFLLTQQQLESTGQLQPGGWKGGLRPESLRQGEEHSLGFFYWLVAGTSDFLLQKADPTFRKDYFFPYKLMTGFDSPMGTASGLSKYPYIRESRRLIGRPSLAYPDGFQISESDITKRSFPEQRGRPYIFFDSLGVGQYPIDFHDCILEDFSLPAVNNKDSQSPSYPYQIPLRAIIPQRIENLLAGNKNIAVTRIASASYRVHPVEWAIGAAAGNTAGFGLTRDLFPSRILTPNSTQQTLLQELQTQMVKQGNPITFPGTTIFETKWADPQ